MSAKIWLHMDFFRKDLFIPGIFQNFIHILQEDTAVATSLACTGDVFGYAPFDMQLEVLEFLFCQDVAFLLVHSENTVFYDPFGRSALSALPSGKVFSVKQDDGL